MLIDPETLTAASDDDLDALRAAVLTEMERRAVIATAEADALDAAARYEQAIEATAPQEYHAGMVIGPGQRVIEDGDEYRNTSGAWLSVPPSAYRLGYELTIPPDPAAGLTSVQSGESVA